jgi:GT2 family glycosyltransferase
MITVVIVTYNSEKDIQRCLRSLFSQGVDLRCIVVDNASQDGTLEKLNEFSGRDLTVIRNEENVGFAKAVNLGVKELKDLNDSKDLKEGTLNNEQDYVLLLNPDAEMEGGALQKMLETMSEYPQAAIVQPLITLMRKPDRVNTSGNRYRGFGLVTIGDFGEAVDSFADDRLIEYASGACMLIKSDVFQELGGLDEKFFLYFEDTDFSRRARQAGHEIWLSAQARVRHDHSFPFGVGKLWNFMRSWGRFLKGAKKNNDMT